MKDKKKNLKCMMNEDIIFKIDFEEGTIKPFRLERYLLFKFPSWLDVGNGTVLYSGGLRQ